MKKIFKNTLATLIILLGIVGLFLPFLQGFLLLFLGAGLLDFKRKKIWFAKLKQKPILGHLHRWWHREKLKIKHHFKK